MKIKRGYSDTTFQDCEATAEAAFGQQDDKSPATDPLTTNQAFGFDGPVSIKFVIPAGHAPTDVMLSAGAGGAAGAGNQVRAKVSKVAGDLEGASYVSPGARIGGFRIGDVKGSTKAYTEYFPGDVIYINSDGQKPGAFWLVWNTTKR